MPETHPAWWRLAFIRAYFVTMRPYLLFVSGAAGLVGLEPQRDGSFRFGDDLLTERDQLSVRWFRDTFAAERKDEPDIYDALAQSGILAALFARARTGRGQRTDVSLLGGALADDCLYRRRPVADRFIHAGLGRQPALHHTHVLGQRVKGIHVQALDERPAGQAGLLLHLDLANVGSVAAILTEEPELGGLPEEVSPERTISSPSWRRTSPLIFCLLT